MVAALSAGVKALFNANTIRAVVALKLHAMIWSLLPLFFSALLLACTSATAQHEDVFDQ